MSKLPDTLSGLLRVAVEDAKKIELSDKYKLNMNYWHMPADTYEGEKEEDRGKCYVCMAGAVMAERLGASPDQEAWPDHIANGDESTHSKLLAIDLMRQGNFDSAAEELELAYPGVLYSLSVTASDQYGAYRRAQLDTRGEADYRMPWEWYLERADELERLGL